MSKKNLLNEATVRRFMKLANMDTLSENFVTEMGAAYQADEDEAMDDDMPKMDDEMGDEEPPMDDMPELEDEDEDPVVDMADEEEMEEPEADEVEITEDDRAALAAAIPVLEKIAGAAEAEMDMGDMMGGEEEVMQEMMSMLDDDMMEGDHEEMEEGMYSMEEDDMMEAAHDDMEEGMYKKDELDEVELVNEDDLVSEVTRRVASRLREIIKSRK